MLELASAVTRELRGEGLSVKADMDAADFDAGKDRELLGWVFEGREGVLRPSRARVWRARLVARELLRRGRVRGRDLERWLGHVGFITLLRREALCIFDKCFAFCRHHYTEDAPLWESVAREIRLWDHLSPLIWTRLDVGWCPWLYAVDASPWGLGAVRAPIEPGEARTLGGPF